MGPANVSRVKGDASTYVVRRSAAMGEVDSGFDNFVANLSDIDRGEVAGYNGIVSGDRRLLVPRISKRDYEILKTSRLEEAPGHLEGLLTDMQFLPAGVRQEMLRRKKAVKQPMPDGGYRVVLVDRLPEALDESEMVELGYEYPDADRLASLKLEERRKSKKYTLTQVFNDASVLDKYVVGDRQLQTAKRLAVSDARAAAGVMQDAMNLCQDDVNVRVVAGEYLKDKTQAKSTLGTVCMCYKPTQAVVLSEFIGEEVFLYGPEGLEDWHVSGPNKYAREIWYLYWLLLAEGLVFPNILLGTELAMLGINVYDGQSCAEPELEYHAGVADSPMPPIGISERAGAMMSSESRFAMEKFSDRLLPVVGSGGDQIATAIRVTGVHVLINSHVLDSDPTCTVGDKPVEAHTQLSRDLWSARVEGEAEVWPMREPIVGEHVVVCYTMGGTVSCSSPVMVTSVDESCVMTTMTEDAVARMSGGALVALSDLSLLGVHSASTLRSLVHYRFGAKQFSALLDSVSESCFSRQEEVGSFAAKLQEHFRKRGLGGIFSTAVSSVLPVYVGHEHVGMAVRNGTHIYTSCDAELPLRFGPEKAAYVMETAEVGALYKTATDKAGVAPVFRRKPQNHERVFVVGFDTDAYLSMDTHVMHVGPNSRSFVIGSLPGADKPLQGGLVMGLDGAVMGVCGRLSATTAVGLGHVCWPLPDVEVKAAVSAREVLASKFPFLNLAAWPDSLLEEVFTHSSVGNYRYGGIYNAGNKPLANIGDNAAKAELYESMRVAGIPHSTWSLRMQALQSNATFARLAWEKGYAECLKVGLGASFAPESKVYADLTEALLGAAYLVERREVFVELCATMGVLHTEQDSGVSVVARGMRTPSLGEEAATKYVPDATIFAI